VEWLSRDGHELPKEEEKANGEAKGVANALSERDDRMARREKRQHDTRSNTDESGSGDECEDTRTTAAGVQAAWSAKRSSVIVSRQDPSAAHR
jgi:hypothetical protein